MTWISSVPCTSSGSFQAGLWGTCCCVDGRYWSSNCAPHDYEASLSVVVDAQPVERKIVRGSRCCVLTCVSFLSAAMGFDNVWNARKGPRQDGKVDTSGKGNPISGKGTRECRCDHLKTKGSGWFGRGGFEEAQRQLGAGRTVDTGPSRAEGTCRALMHGAA